MSRLQFIRPQLKPFRPPMVRASIPVSEAANLRIDVSALAAMQIGFEAANTGRIYGARFGAVSTFAEDFSGFEASAVNISTNVRGATLGIINSAKSYTGVVAGAVNRMTDWFKGGMFSVAANLSPKDYSTKEKETSVGGQFSLGFNQVDGNFIGIQFQPGGFANTVRNRLRGFQIGALFSFAGPRGKWGIPLLNIDLGLTRFTSMPSPAKTNP
jgi:hypothetical protein